MSAKPLVWTKPTDHPCDHDGSLWCAAGIGGRYSITSEGDHYLLWLAEDEFVWRSHPTVTAAMDAAEANWQAAYLKAAAPATQDEDPHAPCSDCGEEHPIGFMDEGLCPSCGDLDGPATQPGDGQ